MSHLKNLKLNPTKIIPKSISNETTIHIRNLSIKSLIGIYEWEQQHKQELIINATLTIDTTVSSKTDQINDTVNYQTVCEHIIDMVENNQSKLIEQLIERLAKMILTKFDIYSVKISIDKPNALSYCESVALEIERSQSSIYD